MDGHESGAVGVHQVLQTAARFLQEGKVVEARRACEGIHIRHPEHPAVLHLAGLIAQRDGRLGEAEDLIRRSVLLAPDNASFHSNLAALLGQNGRHQEAVSSLETALRLQPDNPDALNNLGTALEHVGRFDDAVGVLQRAVSRRPDRPAMYVNLANALRKRGDPEAAVAICGQALRLDPNHHDALNSLGAAFLELCQLTEARQCFERAVAVRPSSADGHYNLAVALLAAGEFSSGWREYAWRRDAQHFPSIPQEWGAWIDADLSGKTILIRGEGGLGNVIQFVRYASLVHQRGATVIVQCQERLARLLANAEGVEGILAGINSAAGFDESVMLRGLPALFGTTIDRVPHAIPYLKSDTELASGMDAFLKSVQGFRIGVCWQGSQELIYRRNRSFPSTELASISRIDAVRLISLQVGAAPDPSLPAITFPDLDQRDGGFMDTAAIMKHLDLVISCDTSVAHLAGALGTEVWVALPFAADWRWMLNRDDSPWYTTMRLFRQESAGHWEPVFRKMADEIRRRLAEGQSLSVDRGHRRAAKLDQ